MKFDLPDPKSWIRHCVNLFAPKAKYLSGHHTLAILKVHSRTLTTGVRKPSGLRSIPQINFLTENKFHE